MSAVGRSARDLALSAILTVPLVVVARELDRGWWPAFARVPLDEAYPAAEPPPSAVLDRWVAFAGVSGLLVPGVAGVLVPDPEFRERVLPRVAVLGYQSVLELALTARYTGRVLPLVGAAFTTVRLWQLLNAWRELSQAPLDRSAVQALARADVALGLGVWGANLVVLGVTTARRSG